MKFAKQLERDLVPEWRIKYLNYKAGKKHVKAISRAISRANTTPSINYARKTNTPPPGSPAFVTPPSRPRDRGPSSASHTHNDTPRSIPIPSRGEHQSLTEGHESDMQYGSIVPTPPERGLVLTQSERGHSPKSPSGHLFELPAPAIKVPSNKTDGPGARQPAGTHADAAVSLNRLALHRSATMPDAHPGAPTRRSPAPGNLASGATVPNMTPSDTQTSRTRLRRMFSLNPTNTMERYRSRNEYNMQTLDEVRVKEREFFEFLDSELEKVETFYRQKEDHAGKRLTLLREQLHEMRNRRTSEIAEARRRKREGEPSDDSTKETANHGGSGNFSLMDPLKARLFKPGPNSKALSKMTSHTGANDNNRRDYVRRPPEDEVPYRTAKRKLKLALQEFYRGLELLKSYALLNRTAFRKLNKKYDKAALARPPYRYMTEKVNKSWFVNSDVLESHLQAAEDLYARYFERGNHKIAAGKLRSLSKKKKDESGRAFENGLFIGVGGVFAVQGLVYGAQLLFDEDAEVRSQTSYLMQIYGGYFLMLYLFSFFCLNCKLWTTNRVNYPFIFEFDARSQLDWRQLSQFPSLFICLLGLFMWLNFTRYGSEAMYLYYPVILIFVSVVVLFFPAPILFHKSRKWFLYSHWRLFFAGLYPVEFRDFFLGDMYCSLSYAMCNIELFFCLYAKAWDHPTQCNSNHSRLLGFFACLPPIWRFLQCIRRYRDTGNFFPHLVNCGKYTASILAGVLLSVYRIDGTRKNLGLFIAFSLINSFYTAFWDVFMDFSLVQPRARHRFLRDITALKSRWTYYAIMILDPILRFNWVFYAIFTHDTQHSSIASFLIGFAEVTRRGVWTLLRVENEHCANVAQYKASRDVPLPYQLDSGVEALTSARVSSESSSGKQTRPEDQHNGLVRHPLAATASWSGALLGRTQTTRSTGVELPPTHGIASSATAAEEGRTPGEESLRMRRRADTAGKMSITRILAEAHKQDFEKKRRPEAGKMVEGKAPDEEDEEEDDDDDYDEDLAASEEGSEDDTGSMLDERMEIRETEMLAKSGKDGEAPQ